MGNIARKLGFLILAALLMVMGLSGVALADSGEPGNSQIQIIDGYQVALIFASPARVDENQFHLRVSDAHEHPVPHAVITVHVIKDESNQAEAEHGDAGHGAAETSPDTHNNSADSSAHTDTEAHSDANLHGQASPLTLEAGEENGEYVGEIVIPQAGPWIMRAHLIIDDLPMDVDFPITVAPAQQGWSILTGFFAVNAVIVGAAVILRPRKPAKTPQPYTPEH